MTERLGSTANLSLRDLQRINRELRRFYRLSDMFGVESAERIIRKTNCPQGKRTSLKERRRRR